MTDINSKFIETIRPDGQVIRCLLEACPTAESDVPVVIIVPPYAKTMRDVFSTSQCMVYNGFRSWRFDYTNHIGASDGDMFDFTLSSAIKDLKAVLSAVREMYKNAPLGIISISLGAPIVFRALKQYENVGCLVSLVGVVNVQDTLFRVIGEDLVDDFLKSQLTGHSREVLGYEVSTRFIMDVVNEDWYSLDSTCQNVKACKFPIVQIAAESDTWVLLDAVKSVFGICGISAPRKVYIIPGASHKLENNPTAARIAHVQAVMFLRWYLMNEKIQTDEVRVPSFLEIVKKNRQEREFEKDGYRTKHQEDR